jgi:translation initiation factor 1 (eIF-1/SUI1)
VAGGKIHIRTSAVIHTVILGDREGGVDPFLSPFFLAMRLKRVGIQQRNGRKTLTTVQGLDKAYDPKKILKAFKKVSPGRRGLGRLEYEADGVLIYRLCHRFAGLYFGFRKSARLAYTCSTRSPSLPRLSAHSHSQEFACNGNVVSSEEAEAENTPTEPVPAGKSKPNFGQVIQLQGDQRNAVRDFLVGTGIVSEKEAKEKIQMYVLVRVSCAWGTWLMSCLIGVFFFPVTDIKLSIFISTIYSASFML